MEQIQTNLWQEALARGGPGPRHARLAEALREAVRDGRLQDGDALPPSRDLAVDLGCSRWVVTQAYEQLVAEGYLEARVGAGTRVRRAGNPVAPGAGDADVRAPAPFDLLPGLPDLRAFPRAAWARVWREALATTPHAELGYPPPGGHPRLRHALADYLGRVRGARVSPEHVTVTAGVRDGVGRLSSILAGEHRRVAVEDPGWSRLRATIAANGLEPVPLAVDGAGARTDDLDDTVSVAVLTPAHHFPTGTVLSPARRAAALAWAYAHGGLLVEDDYDAEFRYDRRPVGALQGLAPERVALFGSVSKTLAPALRLGWAVTPPGLTPRLRAATPDIPVLDQLAMARFLESGAYDRHLRQLRRGYRARRDRLVAALARELPGWRVSGVAAGLHLLLEAPAGPSGAEVVPAAGRRGVAVMDLDFCRLGPGTTCGLVLGYGNLEDRLVERAVAELAAAVRTAARD